MSNTNYIRTQSPNSIVGPDYDLLDRLRSMQPADTSAVIRNASPHEQPTDLYIPTVAQGIEFFGKAVKTLVSRVTSGSLASNRVQ